MGMPPERSLDIDTEDDWAEAERMLGLEPAALRLGVVGAPRREKDVQLVLDAVHRCTRDDVQLCGSAISRARQIQTL